MSILPSSFSIAINRQKGIALVQVLLISTIISILAIRFTLTAREQINIATVFEQRVKAAQLIKSTQSKIIFTLFTKDIATESLDLFPSSEPWNFYGKTITLEQDENITILLTMQDHAGLLPQQFMDWPMWQTVLTNMGLTEAKANELRHQLMDWQDRDDNSWILGDSEPITLASGTNYRNLPIQLPQEIDWFVNDNEQLLKDIKVVSMTYSIPGFNVLNAPDYLLSMLFPSDIGQAIINQREESQLTKQTIIGILGDNYIEEYYSFFPARQIKLSILVIMNDLQLQETIDIRIQPRHIEPMLIFSRY